MYILQKGNFIFETLKRLVIAKITSAAYFTYVFVLNALGKWYSLEKI